MKVNYISKFTLAAFALATIVSCGKKNKTVDPPKDEVEVNIPCSGPDYWTDKNNFRANALGESIDRMTAKKKAMSNARAQMAADIQTTMKVVGDNYVNSTEFNNKEEITETFQENARTVVDQVISGTSTICEKTTMNKTTGKYTTYVAIELNSDELVSKYNERLSSDERIKAEYNYEKFKETFEKEMAKIGG